MVQQVKITNTYTGFFMKYVFRDLKSGFSIFRFRTTDWVSAKYCGHMAEKNGKEDVLWRVLNCKTVKNSQYTMPTFEVYTPLRITGTWNTEGKYTTFHVESVCEWDQDPDMIRKYISQHKIDADSVELIMQLLAKRNESLFTFLERSDASDLLIKEVGLSYKEATEFVRSVQTSFVERTLFSNYGRLGVSYAACVKAAKRFGDNAMSVITHNPYQAGEMIGLPFSLCDIIANKQKVGACDFRRIGAVSKETSMRIASSGHVFQEINIFRNVYGKTANEGTYQDKVVLSAAYPFARWNTGTCEVDGDEVVFNRNLRSSEEMVFAHLKRLTENAETEEYTDDYIAFAEKECGMSYGKEQRQAFRTILSRRGVFLLTGGPGTGKTTTLKGILLSYMKQHPDHTIKLCAPTGRAAQRMSESTGMESTTVHRLIEYKPYGDTTICKDGSDPIDADLIVVDEMSMMDSSLFALFLGAVKTGTKLIFVGDYDQLLPVGPGAVLRDMMMSSDDFIGKAVLKEVFRQKGGSPIVDNAARIRNGVKRLDLTSDFQLSITGNDVDTMEKAVELMKSLYNRDDPFETQILCPARKGKAGVDNLNHELQNVLNPNVNHLETIRFGKTEFRVNDKIIMIRNNYEADYYNGDIGIVKSIENGRMFVEIRGILIEITKDLMEDIKLSYAMTIHKSQGSEFKNCIIVLPAEPSNMLVRNLIYTAVTRAKKTVHIVSEGDAKDRAIVNKAEERKTFLQYLLSGREDLIGKAE